MKFRLCFVAVWEEFGDAVNGMVCDALQHVIKPDIRFYAMHLAGAEQGVEHTGAFGGFPAVRDRQ